VKVPNILEEKVGGLNAYEKEKSRNLWKIGQIAW
jgi:hypothetical protein